MPAQSRIDAPGTLHHVIIRGIERRMIFRDNKDREDFLDRLGVAQQPKKNPCSPLSRLLNMTPASFAAQEVHPRHWSSLKPNRFSVPFAYASRTHTLKVADQFVSIYDKEQLLAKHKRAHGKYQLVEDPRLYKGMLLQPTLSRPEENSLGEKGAKLVYGNKDT